MTYPAKGKADYFELGGYNAVCYDCGRKFKASMLRKNWQGFWECPQHWTPRQPQDFVRAIPETITAPWAQPQSFAEQADGVKVYEETSTSFTADFTVTSAQAAARTVWLTVGSGSAVQGPYPITVAITEGAAVSLTQVALTDCAVRFGWA